MSKLESTNSDHDKSDVFDNVEEDFASMFEASNKQKSLRLRVGDHVTARIIHMGKEDIFCAISPTQEAVIAKDDFLDEDGKLTVKVGDKIDAFVISLKSGIQLSKKLGRNTISTELLTQAVHSQLPVEGTVTAINKGGLEISVGCIRAFCPIGQVDLNFIEDPQQYIGKTLQFAVKEVREGGRNVVLSRRALLEAERCKHAKTLLAKLDIGQRLEGKVTRLATFGAFVDLGGIEGLLPISEIAHAHIDDPSSVLHLDDVITVEILRIEPDSKHPDRPRIALSRKATLPLPFIEHHSELIEGNSLPGKVSRIEKYGAFIEIFPGLEGLIHISEMSHKRVRHPSDILSVGQEISVRILSVNEADQRIGLSLKEAVVQDNLSLAPGTLIEGTVERVERYGIFMRLEGGASALLPAAETGTPPGADLAKAFAIGSTHALVVLENDDRNRMRVSKKARVAAEERQLVDSYQSQSNTSKSLGTLGDLLRAKKLKR
ncbi:MAG: S1 RNA-binding domain-containing protein [Deltaproteobacteria bacterium]|nr:S1 RNA-binding domain-containing protein [Deltaproteobacteria bacterium]